MEAIKENVEAIPSSAYNKWTDERIKLRHMCVALYGGHFEGDKNNLPKNYSELLYL